MKRRTFLVTAATASSACFPGPARRLNVYNWSSYIAPETIPDFEREYNVRVRYVTFESVEEMLAKVATGNCGFDVVFPTNNYIAPMRESRLLAPVDHALLTNLDQLESRFQSPPWDTALRWCVPYMHSTTGIVHNVSVQPPPSGWSDFWSSRFGRRATMLDDPNEVLGACLKKLGLPLNSFDAEHLRRARDAAIDAKRMVRAFINAEVKDQLVAGDVVVAQLWATMAQQGIDAQPALRFVHPAEGFALYCDNAVILAESRRSAVAHLFINYLLRPDVSARISLTMRTPTANAGAFRYLPAGTRENRTLYPSEVTLSRGEWFEALPPEGQRLRDRIWTEIKAA
jgi:spermidine/putrescine transport system substrate-binding protein